MNSLPAPPAPPAPAEVVSASAAQTLPYTRAGARMTAVKLTPSNHGGPKVPIILIYECINIFIY